MRESAFDKKKKKTGLKFHPGLALSLLSDIWTTGPWCFARTNSNKKYLLAKVQGRKDPLYKRQGGHSRIKSLKGEHKCRSLLYW